MQIVQPGLGVVVIPPISERIERADNPLLNRCRARLSGNRAVAPCVIGIGAYLGSVFRVDGDDVPLQVLLEVVGVEYIFGITLVSVLQPDGSAVLVVQVYKTVYAELLRHDLAPVQQVAVLLTANRLGGQDPVCIVGKPVVRLPAVGLHPHQLASLPRQVVDAVFYSRTSL